MSYDQNGAPVDAATLAASVAAEAATRAAADVTLAGSVTTEAGARATADALLMVKTQNLADVANAGAARTNLGLGTLATQSGTFSGTSSGTNTGDQTITLTGDATGSGVGSFAVTVAKVNGVAVTGTPSVGMVPTATSGAAATWQTPSAGASPPTLGSLPVSNVVLPDSTQARSMSMQLYGTTWASYGQGTIATVGTASDVSTSTKRFVRYVTLAGTTGLAFGIKSSSDAYWRIGHNPVFEMRILTDSTISVMRLWIGLLSSDFTNSDTLIANSIGFWYSTEAGHTTWQLASKDGTTQSATNTLVTVSTATEYVLRFQVEGANVRWSITNVTTATLTTGLITSKANMPTAASEMYWWARGFTNENANKALAYNSQFGGTPNYT